MVFFSVGLPSAFAEWCDEIIVRLAHQAAASVKITSADTLEDLAVAVIRTGSPHIVVASRQPGYQLRRAISQSGNRFVMALSDPRVALCYQLTQPNADFIHAVRRIGSSCAAMVSLTSVPGALILHATEAGSDLIATVEAIAHHLGLSVDDKEITNIVAEFGGWNMRFDPPEDNLWFDQLDESRKALISGALDPYGAYFAGSRLETLVWERELFLINEFQRIEAATRSVDITGPPRCLIYGPYISLPPGSWFATLILGFSREAAELSYIAEIVAWETELTHVKIQPTDEGYYEANLSFHIDEAIDQPIQVRVRNESAAFDGRLALGYLRLRLHSSAERLREETREFFATALTNSSVT